MTPDDSRRGLQAAEDQSSPAPAPRIFSEAAAQAALERLMVRAAAQRTVAATPTPAPCEAVEPPAEASAISPEAARRQFEAAVQASRKAFAAWTRAKENQFEQVVEMGWSAPYGDLPAFLEHLAQEAKRLWSDAEQTESDISSSADAAAVEDKHERLQARKVEWDKLRAEGVPIEQRPLDTELPMALQFRFQAETDPTGKDMEWWKANRERFYELE